MKCERCGRRKATIVIVAPIVDTLLGLRPPMERVCAQCHKAESE